MMQARLGPIPWYQVVLADREGEAFVHSIFNDRATGWVENVLANYKATDIPVSMWRSNTNPLFEICEVHSH